MIDLRVRQGGVSLHDVACRLFKDCFIHEIGKQLWSRKLWGPVDVRLCNFLRIYFIALTSYLWHLEMWRDYKRFNSVALCQIGNFFFNCCCVSPGSVDINMRRKAAINRLELVVKWKSFVIICQFRLETKTKRQQWTQLIAGFGK